MKIQLDDDNQYQCFDAMIDVITQTWSMDSVEQVFINQLSEALKQNYNDRIKKSTHEL